MGIKKYFWKYFWKNIFENIFEKNIYKKYFQYPSVIPFWNRETKCNPMALIEKWFQAIWKKIFFQIQRGDPCVFKNIFFKNRLKSFFYQSHWIAFGLTIPKWYNTWVLEIFFVNIFFKNIFQIFLKNIFQIFLKYICTQSLQCTLQCLPCFNLSNIKKSMVLEIKKD